LEPLRIKVETVTGKCPVDAIEQKGILYVINQEICTECGTCESVCPRKTIIPKED
jgi:Fe-S-cluster-containing hydrogenase component 2